MYYSARAFLFHMEITARQQVPFAARVIWALRYARSCSRLTLRVES